MKSATMMNAVVAALAIAASADVKAVTVRTDLDADTRARLELLERMRASRGIRYFNTSNPMPAPVVVQAAPVTQMVILPTPPPAPSAPTNCIPAGQAAPTAPAAQAPAQSVVFQEQTVAGSAGTGPAYSLMSRVSASVASRARSSILQALFDARSLRLYGVAPGQAAVTTITPVVTVTNPAPAPAAPSLPVCPPAGSSESFADNGSGAPGSEDAAPAMSGRTPDPENPFLAEDLLPGFSGPVESDGTSGDDGSPATLMAQIARPSDVLEPGSLALLGLGLIGLGMARRRRD